MNPAKEQPAKAEATRESDIYDALAWLDVNKKRLGIGALLLVAIGFGLVTTRYMAEKKELEASSALLALKPTLVPATNAPPPQASAFTKVAEDFKGTTAAERALLLAANTLFVEGKYSEAEAQFSRFFAEHSASPWAPDAAYGKAASLEALGKTNEALSAYQAVTTAYPGASVSALSKLALGRMHEAQGQASQALKYYNDLTAPDATGQSSPNTHALQRKQALLKSHPELNTNNAALAPAPLAAPSTTLSNVPAATPAPAAATPTNSPAP